MNGRRVHGSTLLGVAALMMAGSFGAPALAGVGPWVVAQGDESIYVGIESQTFRMVRGAADQDPVELGDGFTSFGAQVMGSYGLLPRVELSASVPWGRVRANNPQAGLCAALDAEFCRTTEGVGILAFQLKTLVLDELTGAPVSVSIVPELRIGTFHAGTRNRFTSLGEGSTDLGAQLSVGRGGVLGKGYWSAALEGGWRYRFPNTRNYPGPDGQISVPGNEFMAAGEFLYTPRFRLSVGPTAGWLYRPVGVDLDQRAGGNLDDFAALRVNNLWGGGKVILRNDSGVSAAFSVLRTLRAVNNPTDTLVVSAGVSLHNPLPKKE